MSDRAYTSRKAMTEAAGWVAGCHGAPAQLGISRADTDRPLWHVVAPLPAGGVSVHFTGSSGEVRAYLLGIADAHYWHVQAT